MAISETMLADLEKLAPKGVSLQVFLSKISRWKIGGLADLVIRPESPNQIQDLRKYFNKHGINHVVIGMTSNLLFSDNGLRVPCIQIDNRMGRVEITEDRVAVQAGAWVPGLARKIQKAGLTGAEHICGIPGSIGGLIYMNGGSQRKSIGSAVVEVTSVDALGNLRVRNANECQFGYRQSIFQTNNEIIVEAVLSFKKAWSPSLIRREMLGILSSRRKKFPQKMPNCGSVFKSDPSHYDKFGPPGAIIEKLGFKGFQIGGAMIPGLHANFIVNTGNATASDVISIIQKIRFSAEEKFHISLPVEACYINHDGCIEVI